MELRPFLIGFLCALLLVACGGSAYRFYGLSEVDFDHGKLLGPKESDDLPFSKCAPNGESKNPCVVLFTKDFYALKLDYEDTKMRLKECEKASK